MKTYEIKMSRSRWMSLLIAVLLVIMLVTLCKPYFEYGKETSKFIPADKNAVNHLKETWVLNDKLPEEDGYKKIEMTDKTMTVSTTNIIREHQLAADKAVDDAKAAYEAAAKYTVDAEKAMLTIQKKVPVLEEMNAFIQQYELPEGAAITAEELETFKADAQKQYETALKQPEKAVKGYEETKEYVAKMQEAVNTAREGAVKTYSADASYPWITETTEAYEKAIAEAYPDATEEFFASISAEEKDSVIYKKLADEKAKAAEGYALANSTVKGVSDANSKSKKSSENATKALTAFDKPFDKVKDIAAKIDPSKVFDVDLEVVTTPVAELVFEEYEKTSSEEKMMKTEGKVSYKDNKSELTLTFANGEKIVTTFAPSVEYNDVKELSILGYIAFPYKDEIKEFESEMIYKIHEYYINDVILVPIALLVLAILGIIVCYIKRDKMSAAFLPLAFSLVGLIGYSTSEFLKLAADAHIKFLGLELTVDRFYLHLIGYAVVLIVSALHIFMSAKKKAE